ncbi:Putative UBX domain protein [Penicillium brasilianum]|uniref:Putative UBX domain protein n=1 Tax=Penicillium brasilianum TaxID=104259 RepID=A0A0F7VGU2_PENBI|nr:Putative UBX domain protein [Penicillium brasilianum]
MSSAEVDLDQLSESERSALEQYTSVTGQELAEAVPLLRRSQWNVQIAISKFFDGEGPDPLEEARAALNRPEPPFQPGPGINLMNEDLLQQVRPVNRASDPAPRVDTQPQNQVVHRPPFILALLFTPFNLIYRFLLSSFRLFGTLFPFLPRLFRTTASPALQGARQNTTGRRPLAPKDTAARFIREFEEEYGSNPLPFVENGYNMALERAHRDLKFLLVVLLSPEHDDTHSWVRETLLSPEVVEFVNPPSGDGNVIVWGGNVRDSEAYQVANSLRVTKFPFTAVICHTPNVSTTAMSVVARIAGPLSASEFKQRLTTAVNSHQGRLSQLRQDRSQQQASRSLREEQDSAYERSLAIDRERARLRREAEATRQREEQEAAERQAAEEKRQRDLAQWKLWRAESLGAEPGTEVKDAVRISVRLPSGERIMRRFAPDADIEELYAVVECYEVLQDESRSTDVDKPEGFQHQYGFQLVSPMPRAVYAVQDGGTIREKIGRGGNLLVEPIEEDDDKEEEETADHSG